MSRPDSLNQIWPKLVLADWQPTYQNASSLDAGRGEDPAWPMPAPQSLVARHVLCDLARADDRSHPLRRAAVRDAVRFRRPPARDPHQRGAPIAAAAGGRAGGQVLRARDGRAAGARHRHHDQHAPQEIPDAIPFEHDFRHASYDAGGGRALPPHLDVDRDGDGDLSRAVSSARAARCISSGEPSIWLARASAGVARRRARA